MTIFTNTHAQQIYPHKTENMKSCTSNPPVPASYQGGVLYLTRFPDAAPSPPADLGTLLPCSGYSYGSRSLAVLRFPVELGTFWCCGGGTVVVPLPKMAE